MSTDGNDLTIKFASGSVKLVGVGAKDTTPVNINTVDGAGNTGTIALQYIMQGTTKTDSIINTDQASTLRSGDAAGTKLTIEGGAGNDFIINEGSNVYINGGAGADSITFLGKDTVAGHFLIYNPTSDGKDVISGFNAKDTISLTSGSYNEENIKNILSVDSNGDVIIKFDNANQITLKDAVTSMGDKEFTVNDFKVKIPKKWVGTSSANTKVVDSLYKGYTINALGGNDSLTISGSTIYADGSAGNDSIDATADKQGATLASHVYKFKPGEGTDYITGFNKNDTILIDDETATVSGAFVNGQYKLTIKNASKTGYVVLNNYEDANDDRRLYLYIKSGNSYASITGDHFGGGAEAKEDYYLIPNQTQLKESGDSVSVDSSKSNFTIEGNKGNDNITVEGSSNVSIFGGAGKDSIYIIKDSTTYGSGITINGGADNDYIEVETVGGSTPTNPTGADPKAEPKVYVFGATSGHDSIVGFSELDQIQIDSDSTLVSISASGSNAIVGVGKKSAPTKTTATITLVNFASHLITYEAPIRYAIWGAADGGQTLSAEQTYYLPKIYKQTTSSILVDTSNVTLGSDKGSILTEGFTVELGSRNDTIKNESVSNITLDGGSGNDSILNGAENVLIYGGAGNDIITLTSNAKNAVVVAGAGNDIIYGNTGGEHIYRFDGGQGSKNYIVNFDPNSDIIQTEKGTIQTAEVTADGVKLVIKETGKTDTTIYIKGFEGDAIQIQTVGGAISTTRVERIIKGTTGADTIINTVTTSHTDPDGYTISAEGGNDAIYNIGSNVTIDAGAGNDTIYLMEDSTNKLIPENVTVSTGAGNDLIIRGCW